MDSKDEEKFSDADSADEEFLDAADSGVNNLSTGINQLNAGQGPGGLGQGGPLPGQIGGLRQSSQENSTYKADWEKITFFGEAVPQTMQLSPDQIQNNAGGFVYAVTDRVRIRRFLILGTNGGTYYVKEQELTVENMKDLITLIEQGKGSEILAELYEIDRANRAPKQTPLIFCLALVARRSIEETEANKAQKKTIDQIRRLAYKLFPRVCRIPTHVFEFAEFSEKIGGGKTSGWGRSHRAAIGGWYLSKDAMSLAMAITKYQQRNGWAHRDLLRLAHPVPEEGNQAHNDLFLYATKGYEKLLERRQEWLDSDAASNETEDGIFAGIVNWFRRDKDKPLPVASKKLKANAPNYLRFLQAVEIMKHCTDEKAAVKLITEFGLVREHVPTDLLSSKLVWSALLLKMPMTAMIRNLGKMSAIDLLTQDSENAKLVVSKLSDERALRAARIHPLSVLLALSVYRSGRGDKGKLKWTANEQIVAALNDAFYKSFAYVEPTNKRFLLALDVSGSMMASMSGTSLSCREASAAMAMVTLRVEPTCEVVAFQNQLTEIALEKSMNLETVLKQISDLEFGSTDCALPMLWAAQRQKKFDCFIVFTDNETYFGDVHPAEAMRLYRRASGIWDAKLIVCGMTASKFTIADPNDPFMLDIVGFDSSAPELIRNFVMGWDAAPVVDLNRELTAPVEHPTTEQNP